MTREAYERCVKRALKYYDKAGIVLSEEEKQKIEIVDFGLNEIGCIGLEILTYVNTERVCAKEMVLFPYQTCPEHKHVPTNGRPGKEETFRCRYGKVYLYVPGDDKRENIHSPIPKSDVSVFHEIVLNPGDQYTITPETLHWFSAGEDGAVISEFSTKSTDETDVFTDQRLVRKPKID